jgi:hypothetical protein
MFSYVNNNFLCVLHRAVEVDVVACVCACACACIYMFDIYLSFFFLSDEFGK